MNGRIIARVCADELDPDRLHNLFEIGIDQGRTEALNNKVRLITRRAYGFHSANAALALVMLTCGPITLQPPHELHP
jgi:transposase